MKKRCIIHYKGLSNYSNLKQLSKTNKEKYYLQKQSVKSSVANITIEISVMVYQRVW